MKKILLFTAATMAALVSCSKTQVQDLNEPQEISFRAITSVQTKAEHPAATLDQSVAMGVAAYFTGGEEYFAQTKFVHKRENAWGGETVQFWPQTGTLDFYMYAPFDQNIKVSKDKVTSEANLVESTTDLLYGYVLKQGRTQRYIRTILKHAGARVCFTGKKTGDADIKITSIQLSKFPDKGTVVIEPTTNKVTWSAQTITGDVTFTPTNGVTLTANTTRIQDKTGSEGILVIPHTLTNDTKIMVKYSIGGKDVPTPAIFELTGTTWEAGKNYTYNLNFTTDEILFEPAVDKWEFDAAKDLNPVI